MEVMGLMLGELVDDYTVRCLGTSKRGHLCLFWLFLQIVDAFLSSDVFAMPQSGTSVSVESVDPVFQAKMLEMLKQTGRCVETNFFEVFHPSFLPSLMFFPIGIVVF